MRRSVPIEKMEAGSSVVMIATELASDKGGSTALELHALGDRRILNGLFLSPAMFW
ncbi:hypothetical protein Psta_2872 [Pirellula staleyi DSM 6068]|uniref:Uncharacterized protein n=1 Tax=Pirellula staleyi (strain ATCC 27377 / DSM 6068 / ICPB 4128) TaxID=530564 RepID=D2R8J6_PIRSD|nr:hypothetical protein Psta_2872 [Pirellula staleyi DSM 6068]